MVNCGEPIRPNQKLQKSREVVEGLDSNRIEYSIVNTEMDIVDNKSTEAVFFSLVLLTHYHHPSVFAKTSRNTIHEIFTFAQVYTVL